MLPRSLIFPAPSSATPVIAGGKVFISSTDKNSNDLLSLCFDAKSEKELWRKKLVKSNRTAPQNNLATPSPVTDGRYVYFIYGSGNLVGLDIDGNILWSRNLEEKYGNISNKYGYSSSPLLYDGMLYIIVPISQTAYREPMDTNLDSFILAVDALTGRDLWKQPRDTNAKDETRDSYSSPILYQMQGHQELLIIGALCVTSNDPTTGKELWRFSFAFASVFRETFPLMPQWYI